VDTKGLKFECGIKAFRKIRSLLQFAGGIFFAVVLLKNINPYFLKKVKPSG
jgi:hypothetical protein